jgi:hypothetical protein
VALTVLVPLTSGEWEAPRSHLGEKGWWRCEALSVPGARVKGLFSSRQLVPKELYKVRGTKVRWLAGLEPPPGLEIEIELRQRLASRRSVVLGVVLGAVLGGWTATHHPAKIQRLEHEIRVITASLITTIIGEARAERF